MSDAFTITRDEIVAVIDGASEGCAESTREKLRAVAETTDAVAVGWWYCDGVGCPMRQAGRSNQRFAQAFDKAMCAQFNREWYPAFVVRVV